MAVHILVPFYGSQLSELALEYAIEAHPDASITTIFVINPIESVYAVKSGGLPVSESWYDDEKERTRENQSSAIDIVASSEADLDTIIETGQPARKILEYVDNHDVDHTVMGSHGRMGLERAILGSVAETVIRRATVPVTIIR